MKKHANNPLAFVVTMILPLGGVIAYGQDNGCELSEGLVPLNGAKDSLLELLDIHGLGELIPEDIRNYNLDCDENRMDIATGLGAMVAPYFRPGDRLAGTELSRLSVRDPGGRRFQFRSKLIGTPVVEVPAYTDSKSGMTHPSATSSGPAAKWEVFGGMFYSYQETDQQDIGFGPISLPLVPSAEIEIIGGNLGARYMIDETWSVGAQVAYGSADVQQDVKLLNLISLTVADNDIDSLAVAPFVAYEKQDVFGSADLMVDFLYAYGSQDYDAEILPGLSGILGGFGLGPITTETDGTTHTFDLNASLVMDAGALRHGPLAGLRYIDGEVDDYTMSFPGFLPGSIPLPGSGFSYESLVSTLGYQVSFVTSNSHGSLAPQVLIAWEHEFEDSLTTVAGQSASIDQDWALIGAGLGWYATTGWNVVFTYEGRFGSDSHSNFVGLKGGYTF